MKKIENYMLIHSEETKVVIYGATLGGKIIYQILQSLNVQVEYFCDVGKQGHYFSGLSVIGPQALKNIPKATIVIALTRSFSSAMQTLEKYGISNTICEATSLLQGKSTDDFQLNKKEYIEADNFLKKYNIYASDCVKEIVLPSLEVFITEKCSLLCKDCTHLIPYYCNRKHHSMIKVRKALEQLFTVVSKIQDFIILGGEPLLHPELPDLLRWCIQQEQIGTITILTNGTIVPKDTCLDALIETKTRIRVSDYGPYSNKKKVLEKLFEEYDIPVYINKDKWVALGNGEPHTYTTEQQKQMFADCPFSVEHVLLDGKLFRCAHGGHMHQRGMVKLSGDEYVELLSEDILKTELEQYMRNYLNMDSISACCFCNGYRPEYQVVPAVQIERIKD
jgi:organic radical activating enzyme